MAGSPFLPCGGVRIHNSLTTFSCEWLLDNIYVLSTIYFFKREWRAKHAKIESPLLDPWVCMDTDKRQKDHRRHPS